MLAKVRWVPPAHGVSASSTQPGAAPEPRAVLKGEGFSLKGQHYLFVLVVVVCFFSSLHLPFFLSCSVGRTLSIL